MRAHLPHCLIPLLLVIPLLAHAGGPLYVAGTGFDAGLSGQPLTWAGGRISYYTDQGDLSAVLPQPASWTRTSAAPT